MSKEKFIFDVEYQWEILKYIIRDTNGYKALMLVEDTYFALDEQQLIVHALKRFFKKKARIPKNVANFKQEVKTVLKTKRFSQQFQESDRERILKKVSSLFKATIKDGDDIFENCKQFAAFTQVRNVVEGFDITNFEVYQNQVNKLQNAINTGVELEDNKGEFIVGGTKTRQLRRKMDPGTIATPFNQLNRLTNDNGFSKGALLTVIDKGKGGKTAFLVNVGRGYLGLRKKIIVFDLENGQDNYATRFDQSIVKGDKRDVNAGAYDEKLNKIYRKYQRLGAEVIIRRVPAGTTANQMDKMLDDYYREYGIKFNVAIFDYIGLMGANSGAQDDFNRISEAYVDVKNLGLKWEFDIMWTGHHIVRDAMKRRETCYTPNDTAKCIDIHRHVDAEFGINQTKAEEAAGVWRLEIIDQRDGVGEGRCYFWGNIAHQRWDEFTKEQIKAYHNQTTMPSTAKKREAVKKTGDL